MLVVRPDRFSTDQVLAQAKEEGRANSFALVLDLRETGNELEFARFIKTVKTRTDLILVGRTAWDSTRQHIEKLFSLGFHSVIFQVGAFSESLLQCPEIVLARSLYAPGSVFLEFQSALDRETALRVVAAGIVPLCGLPQLELEEMLSARGLEARWLRYLGYYPPPEKISLKDKLVKKYLLELANLRHALRVQQVSDSYDSSSL